jgi:hypothetical protein
VLDCEVSNAGKAEGHEAQPVDKTHKVVVPVLRRRLKDTGGVPMSTTT